MTCGGFDETSTMLIESDRWFTTQTSDALRVATETGSRPTGTEADRVSDPPVPTSKISRRPSGVLTANNFVPSGESAIGRTWPVVSKLV